MSDPTPPQLGQEEVSVLVDAHPGWWPTHAADRSGTPTEVTLLGRGESSTVWRARRGDGSP